MRFRMHGRWEPAGESPGPAGDVDLPTVLQVSRWTFRTLLGPMGVPSVHLEVREVAGQRQLAQYGR